MKKILASLLLLFACTFTFANEIAYGDSTYVFESNLNKEELWRKIKLFLSETRNRENISIVTEDKEIGRLTFNYRIRSDSYVFFVYNVHVSGQIQIDVKDKKYRIKTSRASASIILDRVKKNRLNGIEKALFEVQHPLLPKWCGKFYGGSYNWTIDKGILLGRKLAKRDMLELDNTTYIGTSGLNELNGLYYTICKCYEKAINQYVYDMERYIKNNKDDF